MLQWTNFFDIIWMLFIQFVITAFLFIFFRILKNFTKLEFDMWKAYRILLAGKADVGCIFEQTHPFCAKKIDEILVDALIYGNELKGEEK